MQEARCDLTYGLSRAALNVKLPAERFPLHAVLALPVTEAEVEAVLLAAAASR